MVANHPWHQAALLRCGTSATSIVGAAEPSCHSVDRDAGGLRGDNPRQPLQLSCSSGPRFFAGPLAASVEKDGGTVSHGTAQEENGRTSR